jgi:general secretion pathway protein K
MTLDRLDAVLRQRVATPQNGQILLQLLGPAQAHASMEATKTLHVTVQVRFDNGRQLGSEAVIFVGDADAEPYHVLSWRDGFDE